MKIPSYFWLPEPLNTQTRGSTLYWRNLVIFALLPTKFIEYLFVFLSNSKWFDFLILVVQLTFVGLQIFKAIVYYLLVTVSIETRGILLWTHFGFLSGLERILRILSALLGSSWPRGGRLLFLHFVGSLPTAPNYSYANGWLFLVFLLERLPKRFDSP